MPLHDYIIRIYREVNDPSYIIRFIDYLVRSTNRRSSFTVRNHTVEPLISGILEDIKTKQRYYSLAQFYNAINSSNIGETDTSLFKAINITKSCTLSSLLSTIDEKIITEFFDQKYRTFLIYREVRKRVKHYTSIDTKNDIRLFWNNNEYLLTYTNIQCKDNSNPYSKYKFIEAFEAGGIRDLYYINNNTQYLITDA
jgi:hypothetical protein